MIPRQTDRKLCHIKNFSLTTRKTSLVLEGSSSNPRTFIENFSVLVVFFSFNFFGEWEELVDVQKKEGRFHKEAEKNFEEEQKNENSG
ncbi:MAG: hypothetical protein U9O20_04060 [Patescibacteria group bacterium]|nr:hypothetical protein [Patescibacteria group bacterium]